MNYPESQLILDEIKKAKNILLMCHRSPDLDSIISCVLMSHLISHFGVRSKIISADKIPEMFKSADMDNLIESGVNIEKLYIKKFDLLIATDVSELIRFGFNKNEIEIPVINIDHHQPKNDMKTLVSLLDIELSSTSEAVYLMFKDLGVELTLEEVQLVLLGIVSDSNSFSYGSTSRMFRTVAQLIDEGADLDKVNHFILRRNSLDQMHYWSEMLGNMKVEKETKFAHTSMNFENYSKYKNIMQATRIVGDMFVRTIDGTNFGIVMVETKKNELNISIRSRNVGYGVMDLLKVLGGGGHFDGGGATVKDMKFDDAIEYVLTKSRTFVKNRKN